MIIKENIIDLDEVNLENSLEIYGEKDLFKKSLFFDLEHYVYKKPVCIGVFGCCYYDEKTSTIRVTQYMIENKKEIKNILIMARDYFDYMHRVNDKSYIVTFSGNNDFHVINYLFEKYKIKFNFQEFFEEIDLQKIYEKKVKESIGLKALEKKFNIIREEDQLISGSNLAKTFSKIVKDRDYIHRMPQEKIEKILVYNEQDVVNLFHIYTNWGLMQIEDEDIDDKDLEEDNVLEKDSIDIENQIEEIVEIDHKVDTDEDVETKENLKSNNIVEDFQYDIVEKEAAQE